MEIEDYRVLLTFILCVVVPWTVVFGFILVRGIREESYASGWNDGYVAAKEDGSRGRKETIR